MKSARDARDRDESWRARTTVTGKRNMSLHRGHDRDAFRFCMFTSTSASPGFSTDIVAGSVTGARDTDDWFDNRTVMRRAVGGCKSRIAINPK